MSGKATAAMLAVLAVTVSCALERKIGSVRDAGMGVGLSLADDRRLSSGVGATGAPRRDTIRVEGPDGGRTFIMKAVKDDDGEMVAQDVIDAAVVTARFRNVAERHGKIDLEFQVRVPEQMQDGRWQLRLNPDMFVLEDSVRLESVVITGADYRKAQLKGYQQYERFLSSIVSDTSKFVNLWQLELFLERNIPGVYAFRRDSSEVSDERFASSFGVTERQALEHYTNRMARRWNNRKITLRDRMYRKWVKVPIVTEGLRLDTVMRAVNGDFIYNYTQTVAARPRLRRIDIVLSGDIWESDRRIYSIPRSEPLTFYISSLSSFADGTERYLTRVLERRASANTACWIDFPQGRSDIDLSLGNNAAEVGRIKSNLASLLENREFDLDSILVTASASPEGAVKTNAALAQRRSEGVSKYFREYMEHFMDSLSRERGFSVDENGVVRRQEHASVPFISRNGGENWEALEALVGRDTVLTSEAKEAFRALGVVSDPDERERLMQALPDYRYMREHLYPRLRTVRFDFFLHRKGMVKDTVHTTELDTLYMEGVQALRDRDYERAVTILRPYADYNAAVAFCAMDYNASALSILETLERTPQVLYMLAVVHSRQGEDEKAVQCYLDACALEPSFVHRGNLDPEISSLIRAYGLNREEDSGEDQ